MNYQQPTQSAPRKNNNAHTHHIMITLAAVGFFVALLAIIASIRFGYIMIGY